MSTTIAGRMAGRTHKRNFNLGNWLVGSGFLLLALIFWFPYGTASRTARVEDRGDRVTQILLEDASLLQPLDLDSPETGPLLLARMLHSCAARGVPAEGLELLGPTEAEVSPPGLLFRNKHYAFLLTSTPAERRLSEPPPDAIPALEAYGWPLEEFGPGHAAFFWSELAAPAYTRNLQANYHGLSPRRRPAPGCGHRRGDASATPWAYRGEDDERWITIWR